MKEKEDLEKAKQENQAKQEEKKEKNPNQLLFEKFEQLTEQLTENVEVADNIANNLADIEKKVKKIHNQGMVTTTKLLEDITKKAEEGVKLELDEDDRKEIETIGHNLRRYKQLFLIIGGILLISLITMAGSFYFANRWYESATRTEQEVRKSILDAIYDNGKIIEDGNYVKALKDERRALYLWMKTTDNKSKEKYLNFRKGLIEGAGKGTIWFEDFESEKLYQKK